eukprot:m.198759 g.198759  ORF g.198759 m.198759 type:complete len:204 (-) comp14924_c0_seq1:160-771(-)
MMAWHTLLLGLVCMVALVQADGTTTTTPHDGGTTPMQKDTSSSTTTVTTTATTTRSISVSLDEWYLRTNNAAISMINQNYYINFNRIQGPIESAMRACIDDLTCYSFDWKDDVGWLHRVISACAKEAGGTFRTDSTGSIFMEIRPEYRPFNSTDCSISLDETATSSYKALPQFFIYFLVCPPLNLGSRNETTMDQIIEAWHEF